jgi:hypothetical protein
MRHRHGTLKTQLRRSAALRLGARGLFVFGHGPARRVTSLRSAGGIGVHRRLARRKEKSKSRKAKEEEVFPFVRMVRPSKGFVVGFCSFFNLWQSASIRGRFSFGHGPAKRGMPLSREARDFASLSRGDSACNGGWIFFRATRRVAPTAGLVCRAPLPRRFT